MEKLMNTQSKAKIFADWLEGSKDTINKEAAKELRRLHEVNRELLEALEWIVRVNATDYEYQQKARAAIAKATGEQA